MSRSHFNRKYCTCYVIFEYMYYQTNGDICDVRVSWSKDILTLGNGVHI